MSNGNNLVFLDFFAVLFTKFRLFDIDMPNNHGKGVFGVGEEWKMLIVFSDGQFMSLKVKLYSEKEGKS